MEMDDAIAVPISITLDPEAGAAAATTTSTTVTTTQTTVTGTDLSAAGSDQIELLDAEDPNATIEYTKTTVIENGMTTVTTVSTIT